MTDELTIEDRFAIYQAITFAMSAADIGLFAGAIGRMSIPLDATTKGNVERAKEEAYYAAAFAWNAVNTDIDIDRERSAIDAGFAQAAALIAFEAALDDLDPALIVKELHRYELMRSKNADIRADHESIYERYIEAWNDASLVFNEDYVEGGVLLPAEAELKALYAAFIEMFPHSFLAPYHLHTPLAKIQVALSGPDVIQRSALSLASAAASRKGEAGVCRYCNVAFKGYCAESVNKGVCCECDKVYVLSMLADLYNVIGYDCSTGEAVLGNIDIDKPADESDTDSASLN
jgi:hypothetical protein